MAGNVTGNEEMVTLQCSRCPDTYQEPWGFVSYMPMCGPCLTANHERFWRIWNEGNTPLKDAFRLLMGELDGVDDVPDAEP